MKKYILIFASGITLLACAPQASEAITDVTETVTDAEGAMPSASVAKGKALFEGKCAKCHDLKVIKGFTAEQWAMILPNMAEKAKLIDNQESLVNEYIQWELAK